MTITEAAIAASCLAALGGDEKAALALRAMAERATRRSPKYSGDFAWSRAREPLCLDDVVEGAVTGLDGQYPIGLGILLEGVADRERRVPLGRKSFAAAAVRKDENVVEHRCPTVAPRAFGSPPGPS